MFMFMFVFLVADTQLYKRLCPFVGTSVGPSVRWSVRGDRVGKCENARSRLCLPSTTGIGPVSGLVKSRATLFKYPTLSVGMSGPSVTLYSFYSFF